MSINEPEREAARAELSCLVTSLQERLAIGPIEGSDMIPACRRILNLWIEAGGASLDDEVIGFLGIESQSDHVLREAHWGHGCRREVDGTRFERGSDAEQNEVDELGRFFGEDFARSVSELAERLAIGASPSPRA